MIVPYHRYHYHERRKRRIIAFVAISLVVILSFAAATIFLFRSPAAEVVETEQSKSIIPPATPVPLPTQRPTPTPTETVMPTATPLAAERVAKCKDDGAGGTVQLTANWKVGDTRTLDVVRYRQRFLQRKSRIIVQSSDRYRVTVLDVSPTGYTLEWRIEDSKVQKGADVRNLTAEDLFLQDMLTLLPNLRIVYTTDLNGAYQQIQNWDQVLAFHNQLHDLFNLRMEQTVRSKNTREQLMNATDPMWTDFAQIEQLYTQEIRAYHGIYGLSVGTLQSVRRADQLPSLLGNLPLESETEIKLSTFNPESRCAFLDLRRYLTPLSMQQLLKDYLTRQAKTTALPSSTGDGFVATRIEDGVRYNVDMASSWLQSAQMRRVTMVENLNMVDGIIIVDRTVDADPG